MTKQQGFSLEFRLEPRQEFDLDIEIVNIYEIIRNLEATGLFKDKSLKTSDIVLKLEQNNNLLFDRRFASQRQALKEAYLTQVGIFDFLKPILHLNFQFSLEQSFDRIISQEPYNFTDKRKIVLIHNKETNEINDLYKLDYPLELSENEVFKRSESFHRKLKEVTKSLARILIHPKSYSETSHFSFTGYYDFCSTLFGVDLQSNPECSNADKYLKDTYGIFAIKLPESLQLIN